MQCVTDIRKCNGREHWRVCIHRQHLLQPCWQTIFMKGSTSMVQNGSEWLIFPITLQNKICTGSFANDEAEPWTLDYNFSAIVTC